MRGSEWRRIRLNEMPPQGSPGLNDRQKGTFQKWVDTRPNQDLCSQLASEETQSWYRGYVMSRRLTQLEYRNAVRDLLGQSLPVGEEPPVDGAGGEGFDTVGDSLFTSTLHTEAYLLLADQLVDRALPAGRMEQWLSGAGEQSGGVLRGLLSESQWRLLDTAASADAAGVQSAVQQLIAGFAASVATSADGGGGDASAAVVCGITAAAEQCTGVRSSAAEGGAGIAAFSVCGGDRA